MIYLGVIYGMTALAFGTSMAGSTGKHKRHRIPLGIITRIAVWAIAGVIIQAWQGLRRR